MNSVDEKILIETLNQYLKIIHSLERENANLRNVVDRSNSELVRTKIDAKQVSYRMQKQMTVEKVLLYEHGASIELKICNAWRDLKGITVVVEKPDG